MLRSLLPCPQCAVRSVFELVEIRHLGVDGRKGPDGPCWDRFQRYSLYIEMS